jgi:hypothetical protein
MTSRGEPIPLTVLALDLPALDRRDLTIVTDDVGRECVARDVAQALLAEHRAAEDRWRQQQAEIEQRVIEKAQAYMAAIPKGVPLDAVPEGVSPGAWLMLNDPERQRSKRQSVLEHSLANPSGSIVYTPIDGES